MVRLTNPANHTLAKGQSIILAYNITGEHMACLLINLTNTSHCYHFHHMENAASRYNSEDVVYVADAYTPIQGDNTEIIIVLIVVRNGPVSANISWLEIDVKGTVSNGNYAYRVYFDHSNTTDQTTTASMTTPTTASMTTPTTASSTTPTLTTQPPTVGFIPELIDKLPNRSNITVEVGETAEVSFLVHSPRDQVDLQLEFNFEGGNYPSIVLDYANISTIYETQNHTHPLGLIKGKYIGTDLNSLITTTITNNDAADNVTEMTILLVANHKLSPELSTNSSYIVILEKQHQVRLVDISNSIAAAIAGIEKVQTTVRDDASDASTILIIIVGVTAGQAACLLLAGAIWSLCQCQRIFRRNTVQSTHTNQCPYDNNQFLPDMFAMNTAVNG